MIARLVLFGIRRRWWRILLLVGQLNGVGSIAKPASWFTPTAAALLVATFLSTIGSTWFEEREFHQLPVSRRRWWAARWWIAVPLTSLFVTALTEFSSWRYEPSLWSIEASVLTLAFCTLYVGAVFTIHTTASARRGNEAATVANVTASASPLTAALFAPLLFGRFLPHHFEEITPVVGVLVACAGVLTAYAYLHEPPILARPKLRASNPPPLPAPAKPDAPEYDPAEQAARVARLRRLPLWIRALSFVLGIGDERRTAPVADRLRGLALLAWLESRRDLTAYCMAIVFLAFCWLFGAFIDFSKWPPLAKFLGSLGFLPFARQPGQMSDILALGFFALVAAMSPRGRLDMRVLRAAPLTSHGLIRYIVCLSAISAVLAWALLMAVHTLLVHALPQSARIDVLFAMFTLTTFAQAARIALAGMPTASEIVQATVISVPLALWYWAFSSPVTRVSASVTLASMVTLLAAYVAMVVTITRGRRVYARPSLGATL